MKHIFGYLAFATSSAGGVVAHEWAYEDTADTSIAVAAVSDPVPTAVGLGALALGAAGVSKRLRKPPKPFTQYGIIPGSSPGIIVGDITTAELKAA